MVDAHSQETTPQKQVNQALLSHPVIQITTLKNKQAVYNISILRESH